MDIKQEDLIRFWTYFGFTFWKDRAGLHYSTSTGKGISGDEAFSGTPRMSLDTIYHYAIPELQKKGYSVALLADKGFLAKILSRSHHLSVAYSDNPAETLYKAIMEVIDKEVK